MMWKEEGTLEGNIQYCFETLVQTQASSSNVAGESQIQVHPQPYKLTEKLWSSHTPQPKIPHVVWEKLK